MPSPQLLDAHRAEITDVVALAQAALAEMWGDFPTEDALATRAALTDAVTELVGDYGALAAGVGADFYVEARREDGVPGRANPRMVVPLSAEQIAAGVGWSIQPLFGRADETLALSRVSGLVQRLTVNADRATIFGSAQRDTVDVRWYRAASANACSFCALIASRASSGLFYRSEQTADFDSHNNCRCFPAPVFGSDKPDLPDYYGGFYDEYVDAATKVADENDGKYPLRSVLSQMRSDTGRR